MSWSDDSMCPCDRFPCPHSVEESEPLDMLKAENKRLWEAINTLQRENLTIMLKLQLMDPK